MKKLLSAVTATAVLALGINLPTQAQGHTENYYYCGNDPQNHPATILQTPQGSSSIFISWRSNYGELAGYTPLSRCQQVTKKLNQNKRILKYMVPGKAGSDAASPGLPVICASKIIGKGIITCPAARILWTLGTRDYNAVIKQLHKINDNTSNDPLIQSSSTYEREDGFFIIDVEVLRNRLTPVEN